MQNKERKNKIINLDYVLRGIEKHANHPDILKIKRKMIGKSFCYENVDEKSCSWNKKLDCKKCLSGEWHTYKVNQGKPTYFFLFDLQWFQQVFNHFLCK